MSTGVELLSNLYLSLYHFITLENYFWLETLSRSKHRKFLDKPEKKGKQDDSVVLQRHSHGQGEKETGGG